MTALIAVLAPLALALALFVGRLIRIGGRDHDKTGEEET